MGSDTVSLIIIIACIIMSAYFSATETAFSSLNRIRLVSGKNYYLFKGCARKE